MEEVLHSLNLKEEKVVKVAAFKGRWWVMGEENGRWFLVVDGRRWGPYRDVSAPVFSEDASIWAFSYRRDEGYYVVLNGETFGPYEDVPYYSPALSHDGSVRVVVGKEGGWVRGYSQR